MAALHELYQRMKDLNVVASQAEFSALWGKTDSWFSTSVARHRQPGLDALVRFHVTLKDLEQDSRDAAKGTADQEVSQCYADGADQVAEINAAIWSEITEIARGGVADRP